MPNYEAIALRKITEALEAAAREAERRNQLLESIDGHLRMILEIYRARR